MCIYVEVLCRSACKQDGGHERGGRRLAARKPKTFSCLHSADPDHLVADPTAVEVALQ